MISCTSCGAENVEGAQHCTKCGASLTASNQSTSYAAPPTYEYTPGGTSGSYNQSQTPMQHPQTQPSSEPVHPALPAVVSLLFPGAGLFFVPGKAGLAAIILIAWICWLFFVILLSFALVGLCLLPISILLQVGAALYSYDAAAKASSGKWAPLVFKG